MVLFPFLHSFVFSLKYLENLTVSGIGPLDFGPPWAEPWIPFVGDFHTATSFQTYVTGHVFFGV